METEGGTDTPTRCPDCSRWIEVDRRYVTWCDGCEWNVDPQPPDDDLPQWRQRLEHRLADTLYAEPEGGGPHRPGVDAARVAAYLLSGLVLLLPVTCVAVGIYLVTSFRPLGLAIPIAAIAFGGAWLFRPRVPRLDPEDTQLGRAEAPRLYDVLDRIGAAVRTPPVTAVVLDTEPNLWYTRVGWRRRPVVGIGLPLWVTLAPQQRVAILAHELGHGRNGDARHGWVVWMAESILAELVETFSARELDDFRRDASYDAGAADEATVNTATFVVNATVGRLVRGYWWLLERAVLRSSQRAEYLADRRAAEIAGSDAAATAMEQLVLTGTASRALERSLRFDRTADPLAAVRDAVAEIPAHELDRRLRVSRRRESRTDSTHPPTYLRSRLIRVRPAPSATVVLGTGESAAIDAELAAAGAPLLDDLRRSFPA